MALTTLEITSTTHAAFLPEIWSDDTQDAVEFKEVLSKLVNTKFEDDMAVGRILHVPHRSNMATQTKTEGIANTVVFNTITQTNQDVTVSTYEYAACLLNAIVQAQSKYDDRKALSDKMGYALVRGWETTIAALPQSFSQTVGTYGADTDDSVIRSAWQKLADAGFVDDTSDQADNDAAWVFSPGAKQSLFGQDRYVSRDFVNGKSGIETARLPSLYGIPTYGSNLLRAPSAGQHDNTLFHRSAIILIRQIKPTPKTQYRIEYNADAMLIFDLYAAVEAEQPTETPTTASAGAGSSELEALGDSGAVLIKGL
jgi:hypothetical protein